MNNRLEEQAPKDICFDQLAAAKKLRKLAEQPFDLTAHLSARRIKEYVATACGFKLLYATQRIDDSTMQALLELADETKALQKMHSMQNGEIVNHMKGGLSENRPALHTATRDFFDQPHTAAAAKEATAQAYREVEKLQLFMKTIDQENFYTDMIAIGIGGSELGPKAIYEALQPYQKEGRKVHFIGNIDPDAAHLVLKEVNLAKSLVVVISKTGTTLETVTNEELFRQHFAAIGLVPENQFISVSCKGSPLDNQKRYLETFHIWEWVGGRYSSTSMVGGLPLAFAYGFPVFLEFLKGANAMDKVALSSNPKENLPLLAALFGIWNRNFLKAPVVAIIPYSFALGRFPAHIQQLDMESNGKQIDKSGQLVAFDTGPIIFGEPGTNAQHSFFQLIHQGTTAFPTEIIGFKLPQVKNTFSVQGSTSQQKLQANMLAQALALAIGEKNDNPNKSFPGNRPSWLLIGKELTPFNLGALLAFYEHKVDFQGFIWNINSFDQMGVELGKKLATRLLNLMQEPAHAASYPLEEALLNELETL